MPNLPHLIITFTLMSYLHHYAGPFHILHPIHVSTYYILTQYPIRSTYYILLKFPYAHQYGVKDIPREKHLGNNRCISCFTIGRCGLYATAVCYKYWATADISTGKENHSNVSSTVIHYNISCILTLLIVTYTRLWSTYIVRTFFGDNLEMYWNMCYLCFCCCRKLQNTLPVTEQPMCDV